jgi:broad specificity phosphatase PhoE
MTLPTADLRGDQRAAIMVRHAERPPLPNVVDSLGIGLTEKGMEDSLNFGRIMARFPTARVWHSPALRCIQTAEGIAQGLQENGTPVQVFQEEWSLCGPYVKETDCLLQAEKLGNRFMREWFDGRIDPRIIDPVPDAMHMVLDPILAKLAQADGLDIHVSHDWDIMLLREALLGVNYEVEGWLPYLDGLIFRRVGRGFDACYRHTRVSL